MAAVLSGVAGFLSDVFLILMIMPSLLAEGPAMPDRVRFSVAGNSAQLERASLL